MSKLSSSFVEGSPGRWRLSGEFMQGQRVKELELMSDDDEFSRVAEIERAANGKPSYLNMDAAFCARMHAAITAGLESAPTGVVTTPGTYNPRYVPEPTARYLRQRNER